MPASPPGFCHHCGVTTSSKCGRCKSVRYCGRACQSAAWSVHKPDCSPPSPPSTGTVRVMSVSAMGGLRRALRAAVAGETVRCAGRSFNNDGNGAVVIDTGVTLVGVNRGNTGDKRDASCIRGSVNIKTDRDGQRGGSVRVEGLHIEGGIDIAVNRYASIQICNVHAEIPRTSPTDVVIIRDSGGPVLLKRCDLYGGSDTVCIDSENVTIQECEIRFAAARGIFANNVFTIKDSEVSSCGGYGMKLRGGPPTIIGECEIQPGPWDNQYGPLNFTRVNYL